MSQYFPRVAIFGATHITLYSALNAPEFETTELECRCFISDDDLEKILIEYNPHVIITVGNSEISFAHLMAAPFEIRRRWLHYPNVNNIDQMGIDAFNCYLSVCLDHRPEEPLVSIFTPTYKTGKRFERAFYSLQAQGYRNWEWIIIDDSDDEGETYRMLESFAVKEHRIKLFKPSQHSGIIGDNKYIACMLSRGSLLVELDHDDELTPDALSYVVTTYKKYPMAGFFYSDCAEVNEQGDSLVYPEGWGFGYGSYRQEYFRGKLLNVVNACNINSKTIRHLVAAPNHVRVWTRECYFEIGGHNRFLHVADDFELMIRTFLNTIMVRIPKLCYLQYIESGQNTQRVRNKDIQRHVRFICAKYDEQIHQRFLALGVDDWIWNDQGYGDMSCENPDVEPFASIIAEL